MKYIGASQIFDKFEKEKELHPVLYQEPLSPPFDTDIPNESSGSEEEPEAISIYMHFC